jgi:hypothetical protein
VRLPEGVRVTPECVALLRGLLQRDPKKRDGFEQFEEKCEKFVGLGCGDEETRREAAARLQQQQMQQQSSGEIGRGAKRRADNVSVRNENHMRLYLQTRRTPSSTTAVNLTHHPNPFRDSLRSSKWVPSLTTHHLTKTRAPPDRTKYIPPLH